ncbi:hypothetical protein GCM10009795_026300 [Nocardioides hankookensis]|uniref:Uncharacterized protein n=1 Tax=Nocardioides hankookensis TaxID=443157 RepID=A0ABW1LEM0_9ACTN
MGSYPVPSDFFEDIADSRYDEPDDYSDSYEYDEQDDYEYVPHRSSTPPPVEPGIISVAVTQLRALARELYAEHHPRAHVAQQVSNLLLDLHDPRPPAVDPSSEFAPSPVGNCNICGRSLPLPTMRRGRPRKRCTRCSPPRTGEFARKNNG